MTVAELLRDLAGEVVAGRGEWEIDVAILRKPMPPHPEPRRRFGQGSGGLHRDREMERIIIESVERAAERHEL
jgi:hypothetical protein